MAHRAAPRVRKQGGILVKKSQIASLIVFLLLIPLTLYFGSRFSGRAYYFTSTAIIIEIMIPFFLAFERRRVQARELVVIAVMCALAVAARAAIPIPNFKAIFAVIMLTGIAFGPESGFLVGAVSAFVSNFFYGQGPFTPWQMMGYGAAGLLAGFVFRYGVFRKKEPLVMAFFGFFSVVLFVGPLLDTGAVFLALPQFTWGGAWAIYLSGLPVNLSQGVSTFLVLLLLGKPMLDKLERVKVKYGMAQ